VERFIPAPNGNEKNGINNNLLLPRNFLISESIFPKIIAIIIGINAPTSASKRMGASLYAPNATKKSVWAEK